jgi:hypothetical protein
VWDFTKTIDNIVLLVHITRRGSTAGTRLGTGSLVCRDWAFSTAAIIVVCFFVVVIIIVVVVVVARSAAVVVAVVVILMLIIIIGRIAVGVIFFRIGFVPIRTKIIRIVFSCDVVST